MPLYEYQCEQCQERVEILQKWSDPPYTHCPKCAGEMRKLFSSPAIQFKGSGFYKTDYANSGSSNGANSAKSDSKGESSSGASNAESKSGSSSGSAGE